MWKFEWDLNLSSSNTHLLPLTVNLVRLGRHPTLIASRDWDGQEFMVYCMVWWRNNSIVLLPLAQHTHGGNRRCCNLVRSRGGRFAHPTCGETIIGSRVDLCPPNTHARCSINLECTLHVLTTNDFRATDWTIFTFLLVVLVILRRRSSILLRVLLYEERPGRKTREVRELFVSTRCLYVVLECCTAAHRVSCLQWS